MKADEAKVGYVYDVTFVGKKGDKDKGVYVVFHDWESKKVPCLFRNGDWDALWKRESYDMAGVKSMRLGKLYGMVPFGKSLISEQFVKVMLENCWAWMLIPEGMRVHAEMRASMHKDDIELVDRKLSHRLDAEEQADYERRKAAGYLD